MTTPDYMMRQSELDKYSKQAAAKGEAPFNDGSRSLLIAAAAGDEALFGALWSFWNFSQAFDDLLDESGINNDVKETAMASLHDVVVALLLNGDKNGSLSVFLRVWDYLIGEGHWETEKHNSAVKARLDFINALQYNPFIRKHANEVRAMFVSAMLRCLDGDEMAKSDDADRRYLATAVRCGDLDVLFHFIYLARGWAAAREWSSRRDYDTVDELLTKA